MRFKRKIFSALLCAAALASALAVFGGCGAKTSSPPAALSDAYNLHQVITTDSRTSRTIMWQSDAQQPEAAIELRRLGSADDARKIPSVNEKFTDNGATSYIHTASITELAPGTNYEYRILSNGKAGEWLPLSSAYADTSKPFKALIFPDSQSADYSAWEQIARSAWERNQDAQFFINMGDLVDNGEDRTQWNAWFSAVQPFAARIPVAPLMGNHETYNLQWKLRPPLAYVSYFSLPKLNASRGGEPSPQKKSPYQNQFYSFDYGDVHFTVLDTQFTEEADFKPNLQADELAWLKRDLADAKTKWKVVLMHKDPLQYGFADPSRPAREEGFSEEGRLLMPLFDEYSVDVVLSAHLHTLRNRGHIKNFMRSASGPLYIITGVAGDVRYPGLWKQHPLDEYVAPQPETDNYLTLEAAPNSLTFRFFLPDGTELHSVSTEK